MSKVKLSVDYEQHENGVVVEQLVQELAEKPEAQDIEELIIGDWGAAYENASEKLVKSLVDNAHFFPKLRKLFIGDMDYEECEVSWITQSNLGSLLEAYPELTSLTIKGSNELALDPARHEKLEELIIICGGLDKEMLQTIHKAHFPKLRKLELYLGVENYGFDGGIEDVVPFLEQNPFPELKYLGLKDSEIQDEIAIAAANAPVLSQLEVLDLSMGSLTDDGAEALLASEGIKNLQLLDLHYHFMSDEMLIKWKSSGLKQVDVSDQQQADVYGDEVYRTPALTE